MALPEERTERIFAFDFFSRLIALLQRAASLTSPVRADHKWNYKHSEPEKDNQDSRQGCIRKPSTRPERSLAGPEYCHHQD
jgi:hypothetical protein